MNSQSDVGRQYPGREPRTDAEASAVYGEGVEELNKIRTVEPWSSRGPLLSLETIDFMAMYAARRRVGRLEIRRNQEQVKALVDADLMRPNGAWNEAGEFATDGFRQQHVSVEVDAGHGTTRSRLDIKVGNMSAIAVAGPEIQAVLSGVGMSTTHRQLDIVRVEGVPGLIAQWVGLGPAWSLGIPIDMASSSFAGILQAGGPVDSGVDAPDGFGRFWDEPWFEWSVRFGAGPAEVMDTGGVPATGIEMRFVNAGRAGHFHYADDGASVRLTPAPSFSVWMELVSAFQKVLRGWPDDTASGPLDHESVEGSRGR